MPGPHGAGIRASREAREAEEARRRRRIAGEPTLGDIQASLDDLERRQKKILQQLKKLQESFDERAGVDAPA
jgi:prefoldin subunit 5